MEGGIMSGAAKRQKVSEKIKAKPKIKTYDTIAKETVIALTDENVVELINSLFKREYNANSNVLRLDKESINDGDKRIADMYFQLSGHNVLQVNDNIYNIEVQSSEDGTMALRMFEYAVYGARMHGGVVTANDEVTLKLPRTVVLYIRSDDSTPERLKIKIVVYDELDEEEKIFEYSVKTKRIHDYSPSTLAEQCLYILLPLFPLKFERMLSKAHSADVEKLVIAELHELKTAVDTLVESGKLKEHVGAKILDEAHDIIGRVLNKGKVSENILDRKGLEKAMNDLEETVEVTYTWDKAKVDTACRIALNLLRKGSDISTIAEVTELDESDVLILADEYGIAVVA